MRFTIGVAILSTITVLLIPSQYTAETMVLPPSQSSTISSALLSQLGGAGASAASGALASLAGGSLGIKNPSDMYVSLFRSRTVEDSVIQRFGLMGRYHKKRMSDARTEFESHSAVVLGAKDGLIRITVKDRDPKLAAEIANGYVDEFRKLSANLADHRGIAAPLVLPATVAGGKGKSHGGRRGDEEYRAIHRRTSNRQPGKSPD